MKYKELIIQEKDNINTIIDRLCVLYKTQDQNRKEYLKVFEQLLEIEPASSDMTLHITQVSQDYEDFEETWEDVYGTNGQMLSDEFPDIKHEKDEEVNWALEFQAWNKWADMEVDQDTLDKYGSIDVIAHCLFEMTFAGFDEKTIQNELKVIDNAKHEALEEIKSAKPTIS